MTTENLIIIAGAVLSLGFAYVPRFKAWYEGLPSESKALIMLVTLVVVSGGIFGLGCLNWFDVAITCDQAGLEQLLMAFLGALVANQGTYLIAVRPFQVED